MLHLRITVPPGLSDAVVASLRGHDCALNISLGATTLDGHASVMCDVPLEVATAVIEQLQAIGVAELGVIAGHRLDVATGQAFVEAEQRAPGRPSEAVVWQQVIEQVRHDATPSFSFVALLGLAAVIAAIGIITDSAILIVGAMVVGPDYGPVGAITLGLARRNRSLLRIGLQALAVGVPIAVALAGCTIAGLRLFDGLPAGFDLDARPVTGFISRPDRFTVLVALAAGVAGTLSLTEAKAGVLVGVLISVTTVPAIAAMGVGLALWSQDEVLGAAIQLVVNIVCLVCAGRLTLAAQQWWTRLRLRS
jgi:uncharacterized hydrophobic protein (TIGR00271 family)